MAAPPVAKAATPAATTPKTGWLSPTDEFRHGHGSRPVVGSTWFVGGSIEEQGPPRTAGTAHEASRPVAALKADTEAVGLLGREYGGDTMIDVP